MNGLGQVGYWLIGAEVMHKPSGQFVTIERIAPPNGVYVDLGDGTQRYEAEDFKQ